MEDLLLSAGVSSQGQRSWHTTLYTINQEVLYCALVNVFCRDVESLSSQEMAAGPF